MSTPGFRPKRQGLSCQEEERMSMDIVLASGSPPSVWQMTRGTGMTEATGLPSLSCCFSLNTIWRHIYRMNDISGDLNLWSCLFTLVLDIQQAKATPAQIAKEALRYRDTRNWHYHCYIGRAPIDSCPAVCTLQLVPTFSPSLPKPKRKLQKRLHHATIHSNGCHCAFRQKLDQS